MKKFQILVVEDDAPVRNLITTTLRAHDYRFITSGTGEGAVMEVASHNPDIILLDLGLPDIDGAEVIRRVRSWSNVPIIVISARAEESGMPGRGVLGFFPRRWNGRERSPPGRVAVAGFCLSRWNGREPWLVQPGPHFLGRNGGKNPRGKRFFPLDSLLWWGCVGGGCTSYGIPGLRPSQRKARNGPPTGWAGWGRG